MNLCALSQFISKLIDDKTKLTEILKWSKSSSAWKSLELLYLSIERASQRCLPCLSAVFWKLYDKHQGRPIQVNAQSVGLDSFDVTPITDALRSRWDLWISKFPIDTPKCWSRISVLVTRRSLERDTRNSGITSSSSTAVFIFQQNVTVL